MENLARRREFLKGRKSQSEILTVMCGRAQRVRLIGAEDGFHHSECFDISLHVMDAHDADSAITHVGGQSYSGPEAVLHGWAAQQVGDHGFARHTDHQRTIAHREFWQGTQ